MPCPHPDGPAGKSHDSRLLHTAGAAGAAPGWKTNPAGTVWRYRNPQGPSGIVKVRVRQRGTTPGKLKFVVIGRHGSYAMSPASMPLKGTMIIDSPLATTGQCGEALFPGPAPVPHCAFNPSRTTLRCK